MTVASLEAALDALGIRCAVEARDRLAIIIPMGDLAPIENVGVRREALRLAREHGFTHVALEVGRPAPAAVGEGETSRARDRLRINTAPAPRAALHRD